MAGETRDPRSDIGRRVVQRREQLGLSRQAVAERAGIAPQYLRYLEERPASPSPASLTRVARALNMSVAELTGSETPPAAGRAAPRGEMVELDPDQCYALAAEHRVGRVSLETAEGPAIVPVTYALVASDVVFRTDPAAGPSFADEAGETAFEVDHLDETQGVGWSVLLVGATRRITDPAEIREVAGRLGEEWEPGKRDLWVRLIPGRVTGRRVHLG
ncbi:pyridoxamine 5'-phosphate oxidase family protein [Streptomyces sp. DSM 44938]|uniref:Pyridoxamine 5'-phosphate oxidase family protein n=1 Tax=Streptomyces litchfieldiae TaxID=3075543 RepID=A0ABU2MUB4_9ACTN|nr:pyridoxamine 5'-phosphate oxidase family protein [Streptomyces sp. DSM 44938]MDT0345231.1 pyridoxamine 5'-phosphate oxidase family protein [Streptomyces sp. DSM 44938]